MAVARPQLPWRPAQSEEKYSDLLKHQSITRLPVAEATLSEFGQLK